jgi:hypothetical protein
LEALCPLTDTLAEVGSADLRCVQVCGIESDEAETQERKTADPEKQGLRNNTSLPPRAQRRRSIFAYLPSPPHILALATSLRIAQILPSTFG